LASLRRWKANEKMALFREEQSRDGARKVNGKNRAEQGARRF
jgi:hypothetical protein